MEKIRFWKWIIQMGKKSEWEVKIAIDIAQK